MKIACECEGDDGDVLCASVLFNPIGACTHLQSSPVSGLIKLILSLVRVFSFLTCSTGQSFAAPRAMNGRYRKGCCLIAMLCMHPCIQNGTLSLWNRASGTVKVFYAPEEAVSPCS